MNRISGRPWRLIGALLAAWLVVILYTTRVNHLPPSSNEVSLDARQESAASTAELSEGERLAHSMCGRCHGADLSGGVVPESLRQGRADVPLASSLRGQTMRNYSFEDFCRLMHHGLRPDSSPIHTVMPAVVKRELSEENLHAVWLFARTP